MFARREHGRRAGTLLVLIAALATLAEGATQSACEALHQKYAGYGGGVEREVLRSGRAHSLRVYAEARAPARAAAALLAAGLRHRLRYRGVSLHTAPRSLCDLATELCLDDPRKAEPNLVLVPSAVWGVGENKCAALQGCGGRARLRTAGAGAATARLRLLVHLSRSAHALPLCHKSTRWSFYTNDTNLETCSFLFNDPTISKSEFRDIRMYHPSERREDASRLAQRAERFGLRLRPVPLGSDSSPRRELLTLLREGNDSFLFFDYQIWTSLDRVLIVDPPPDESELDLAHTVRLADTRTLRTAAPDILQAFLKFNPKPEDLLKVLEIESPDLNITEAACSVASNNSKFESWFDLTLPDASQMYYDMDVYLCQDNPDFNEHFKVLNKTNSLIISLVNMRFKHRISVLKVDCGDEHALMRALIARAQGVRWARFAGAVGAGAGAGAAAATARALDIALALYDVPALAASSLGGATRLATGRLEHLVIALRHFISKFGWTRLVVLSEGSHFASALSKSLSATTAFVMCDIEVDSNPRSAVRTALNSKARIIFVNSNSSVALSVLCAARDLDMTSEAGYVWILREWYVGNVTCQGRPLLWSHFTMSFWWRGGNVPFQFNGTNVKNVLDAAWPDGTWPLRAAPLVDALTLLLRGFQNFLDNHPDRQYDIHGGNVTRLIWENVEEQSTGGVTQTLKWDMYGVINPLVYIDEWYDNRRDPVAIWQVDNDEVIEVHARRPVFPGRIPSDGAEFCIVKSRRDSFSPTCYDGACFTAVAAGALALPALWLARRVRRRRLRRRRLALTARLLDLSGPLAALLVDRASLELRAQIGAGRFGLVREAVLRRQGRAEAVAAKALRDESTPAEEREFLNEAVILASLRHERVVRILGVCVGGGSPLVLMERAFFRDLLGYLSERRPLAAAAAAAAAGAAGAGEAAHVAAAALTRLARQTAGALEYLGAQGVVHRDVRAANCLVDSRRSLKLADFGLARRTAADGEYSCRRRGLLPVPWMAPESLERGVFSAASDAWGLGVLLLELVTLGARPYGAWPPQRVLRYVSAGGRPPLPPDVTPETRRVLAGCWRRGPRERTSAAALGAFLDANPELLRPALDSPADNDRDDSQTGVALLER